MAYIITNEQIQAYERHLRLEEHSASTILKYAGALRDFYDFLPPDKEVSKELLLEWKEQISADHAASTVNVMISAVNSFFAFLCWNDLHIRQIKTQRQIYRDKERELTKAEYMRLLNAARASGNMRLFYLMQTLGATGIRISELNYFLRRFLMGDSMRFSPESPDFSARQRRSMLGILRQHIRLLFPVNSADEAVVDVHTHEHLVVDDFTLVNHNLLDQRVQQFLA